MFPDPRGKASEIGGPSVLDVAGVPPTKTQSKIPEPLDQEPISRKLRRPLLLMGLVIAITSVILALFGQVIAPYDPEKPTGRVSVAPPHITEVPSLLLDTLKGDVDHAVHWFGTDESGLDVFSRVISAPRIDLLIALASTALALSAGTFLGLIAGYYRNSLTEVLTRASDVWQSFPVIILAMILVSLGPKSLISLTLSIGVLFTPMFLRLTRSAVVTERERAYVESARALGYREFTIALKHCLPNSIAPSLIQAPVVIGWSILVTASLSFLGAGIPPPTPEWGGMIASASSSVVLGEWWPSVFPGVAISIFVFGYALVGYEFERMRQR